MEERARELPSRAMAAVQLVDKLLDHTGAPKRVCVDLGSWQILKAIHLQS